MVLGRHKKDPKKVRALKVVYLKSPEMLEEPEHLEIMKKCDCGALQGVRHKNLHSPCILQGGGAFSRRPFTQTSCAWTRSWMMASRWSWSWSTFGEASC